MDLHNWPPDNPCIQYRVTDLGNGVLRIDHAKLIDAPGPAYEAALLSCCPALSDALHALDLPGNGSWAGMLDDRGDNWLLITSWKL